MAQDPTVVTGTGAAGARSAAGLLQPRPQSHPAEDAMANAIKAVQAESDAIARRTDIDDAEKNKLLAALNDPANVRARMLKARDVALGKAPA